MNGFIKYYLVACVLCWGIVLIAEGDFLSPASERSPRYSDSVVMQANIQPVEAEELLKFYIGFSETPAEKELVTLDIQILLSLNNEIRFHYTMNSKGNRRDGTGKFDLNRGHIEFNNLFAGKIYRDEDQKIGFESFEGNNASYWKIREK